MTPLSPCSRLSSLVRASLGKEGLEGIKEGRREIKEEGGEGKEDGGRKGGRRKLKYLVREKL